MQVILLEKVENLGLMGDIVKVRPGYARNYLLPRGKALRATNENQQYFDAQKKVLAAENDKQKAEAEKLAKKIEGLTVSILRAASEAGSLYGSVTSRDVVDAIAVKGFEVSRHHVVLDRSYKLLGLFPIKISLHPEVSTQITINIARSVEEAKLQEERGEALIATETMSAGEERAQRMAELAAKQTAKAKAKQAAKDAEAEGETSEEA